MEAEEGEEEEEVISTGERLRRSARAASCSDLLLDLEPQRAKLQLKVSTARGLSSVSVSQKLNKSGSHACALVAVFSLEVCLIERVIKKPSEALPSPNISSDCRKLSKCICKGLCTVTCMGYNQIWSLGIFRPCRVYMVQCPFK